MDPLLSFLVILLVVGGVIVLAGLRTVGPEEAGTVVTFGKPGKNVRSGLQWIIPGIQRIETIDKRVQQLNPPVKGILTKDGVPVDVDLFYTRQVTDARNAQFNVRDPDAATLGLVQGMLVNIIGGFTVNQIIGQPELKEDISAALDQVVAEIEDPFGIDVGHFRVEQFRLPGLLEQARTDVRTAAEQRKAAVTRARAEADVVGIERAAEGEYWIPKTQWDTLAEASRAGRPPLVIVGTGGGATDVQTAITAAIQQTLEEIRGLLKPGGES